MYSPRQFQEHRPEVLHALIQQHPLGILVSQKNRDTRCLAYSLRVPALRGRCGFATCSYSASKSALAGRAAKRRSAGDFSWGKCLYLPQLVSQ